MPLQLDETDRKLLDLLQQAIPLVDRPFQEIGKLIGLDESRVLDRIHVLKEKPHGVIRQISAIFDSRALGYQSCLVAAKVDEMRIEDSAARVSLHPGVSHNYRRNHSYNLWYTVAVPPDSRLGLQRTVDLLHQQSGAIVTRLMPALKLFKIGVKFNLSGEDEPVARGNASIAVGEPPVVTITESDKRMIRVLQQDLPIESRPFDLWATQAGVNVSELLKAAKKYESNGVMRRFSAVLRHRQAGFGANAMGAWIVPSEKQEAFGQAAATYSAVSHCYLRPTYEDWPYSMFTMVHGQSPEQCEQVLVEISRQTGISQYAALYSTHEYKKIRVKYFTPDIETWEQNATVDSQSQQAVTPW